jgi:hypothetical protein
MGGSRRSFTSVIRLAWYNIVVSEGMGWKNKRWYTHIMPWVCDRVQDDDTCIV